MSWKHLPAELRAQVISYLELPRVDRDQLWPSQEFVDKQSALRNLCLTSRSTAVEARIWLYRTIILFIDGDDVDFSMSSPSMKVFRHAHEFASPKVPFAHPDSMVQLIRTLTHNPHLRTYIKYVACPFSKSEIPPSSYTDQLEEDTKRMCTSWVRHAHEFSDTTGLERQILEMSGHAIPPTNKRLNNPDETIKGGIWDLTGKVEVVQRLVAVLLCLLPEVDTLLLQACDYRPSRITHQILEKYMNNKATSSLVMPKLATLQLQVHQLRWKRINDLEKTSFDAVYALLDLPTLRHIETWQDDGFNSFFAARGADPVDHIGLQWLPKIETLSLTSAVYDCNNFFAAIRWATSLRRLTMDVYGMEISHPWYSRQPSLDEALLVHAGMLEELYLGTFSKAYKHISEARCLSCLPHMTKLRVLSVEMSMMFGPFEKLTRLSLPDLLPPNLEQLYLVDAWLEADGEYGRYTYPTRQIERHLEALVCQFEQLADEVRTPREQQQQQQLSKLRRVHLRPGQLCTRGRWLQEGRLRHIERTLREVGVEFTYFLPRCD